MGSGGSRGSGGMGVRCISIEFLVHRVYSFPLIFHRIFTLLESGKILGRKYTSVEGTQSWRKMVKLRILAGP